MDKLLEFVNSHLCEQGEKYTKSDLLKGIIIAALVGLLLGLANNIDQLF